MNIESIVIGAGLIGLACARRLAMAGREVVILEAAETFGTETSSRNSEVIHAGIYYPEGSLKAKLCVKGKTQLYQYCVEHGISHQQLGKLIVATSELEIPVLKTIEKKAIANGVHDLTFLTEKELNTLEPSLRAVAGILSPSTGIIDSHGFMLALLGDAEAAGAMLAVDSKVVCGKADREGIRLQVKGTTGENEIISKIVINSAGLSAPNIAKSIAGVKPETIPTPYYCKGSYFTLGVRSPFRHLIYPVPNSAGLGVHLTLDLANQARFGPDTEWVTEPNYVVEPERGEVFYEAIRRYWPECPDGALQPGYVGVRPKITPEGSTAADFRIDGVDRHGVAGLVNLFGIESPGLTAALAIADKVYDII